MLHPCSSFAVCLFLCLLCIPERGKAQSLPADSAFVVTSSELNVRAAASGKAPLLGTVQAGDTIFPTNIHNNWVEFAYLQQQQGFVYRAYLRTISIQRPLEQALPRFSPWTAARVFDASWQPFLLLIGAIMIIWMAVHYLIL